MYACASLCECVKECMFMFFVAWFMIITVYPNVGADERQQLFHLFIFFTVRG